MASMVIIGAGECGTRAAFALREEGWTGDIVLLGDENTLPYERPPLSKPESAGVAQRLICDDKRLQAATIDYRPGSRVEHIDRSRQQVALQDGSAIDYHKLLLATGARPRQLACPGASHALTFRTLADAHALFDRAQDAEHVVLIGAGLIGMELAANLRQAGSQVTVVEAGARALGRAVPAPLADRLMQRHLAAGVTLHLNTSVTGLQPHGVLLESGHTLHAELIVAAIGVIPNTEIAATAGLTVDNGIVVNGSLATIDSHIFAAGDCARAPHWLADGPIRLESWRNAQDQGSHAARAMLGASDVFAAVPWFWSDQYELGLQITGLPNPERPSVRRQLSTDAEIHFQLDDAGRMTSASGLGSGNSIARDIKLAEMLIARGIQLTVQQLQDPACTLKSLLRT